MLVDLTPEQQSTIAGGGLWIVDPMDSTKNVARPSFAFKQTQNYLKQCLDKVESVSSNTAPDSSAPDILKMLMRY